MKSKEYMIYKHKTWLAHILQTKCSNVILKWSFLAPCELNPIMIFNLGDDAVAGGEY